MRIQEVINGKEITIIGTAHISSDSVEEVKQALIEIQPDTVAIELDDERYKSMTETKDWKEMDIVDIIKKNSAQCQHAQVAECTGLLNFPAGSKGSIVRLKGPGNKGGKASGLILQITNPLQVLQTLFQALNMTKHHRGGCAQAQFMGLFHNANPLISIALIWSKFLTHAVI